MNAAFGRPWTIAEDAIVRDLYLRDGAKAVAASLRGRSLRAVYHRAKSLGLAVPPWTPEEDERLRSRWATDHLSDLAVAFGRSEWAIFSRAEVLGIFGPPRGMEWLTAAARRTGYHVGSLRSILKASGVEMVPAVSAPGLDITRHRFFVATLDVDDAVAAWLQTETLTSAAMRRGLDRRTLASRLATVEGVPKKPKRNRTWRVPTDVIDRALADKRRAA